MSGKQESSSVQIRVLGPVDIQVSGRTITLPPLVRTLVAVLAADAGRVVSTQRLAEGLWQGDPPPSARNRMQQAVSALRRALEGAGVARNLIVTSPPGYLLAVDQQNLDAARFFTLVGLARQRASGGATAEAAATYRDALALWRGNAFDGVIAAPLEVEAARLEEVRLTVVEECAEAELANGGHTELVAELTSLVALHPMRERLRGLLMLALYRCGREADALNVYRAGYDIAVGDMGIEPGASLQTLHQAILTRQPELNLPRPRSAGDADASTRAAPMPRQLPMSIPDFVGRTPELTKLRELLASRPSDAAAGPGLAVISGMGGVGKSTLAIRAAAEVAASYPDGSLFADLRGTTTEPANPHSVTGFFLRALCPGESIPHDVDERLALYRSVTAQRRVLVVLDDACDEAQVRPLIPASAGSAVVVTTRSLLLGLEGTVRIPLDVLPIDEGVEFLAAVAGPERVTDTRDAADVVRLCGALPLAVRIAGARLSDGRDLSLSLLATRLTEVDDVLDVLEAGDRSVRACLTLSYAPLDPDAASLFRLLGTLPCADFTDRTCAIALDRRAAQVNRPLQRLLTAHLVAKTASGPPEPRYRQHDLVRRFAAEQAAGADTGRVASDALRRLLDHYTDTAYAAGVILSGGRHEYPLDYQRTVLEPLRFTTNPEAMAWFLAERTNLQTATLEASRRGMHTQTWRLAHALRFFYRRNFDRDDWFTTHQIALASATALGDRVAETRIRDSLGSAYMEKGEPADAITQWNLSLAILTELGDELGQARNLDSLGVAYGRLGQLEVAIAYHLAALAIPALAAYPQFAAFAQHNLGTKYGALGAYDKAHEAFTRALEVATEYHDSEVICLAQHNLAEIFLIRGDRTQAQIHARAEINLARQVHYPLREARGWEILGDCLAGDDQVAAHQAWRRALELYEALNHPLTDGMRAKLESAVSP